MNYAPQGAKAGRVEPGFIPVGSITSTLRQIRAVVKAREDRNAAHKLEFHARPSRRAIEQCLATSAGHARRAGYLREDGKHAEAKRADAEAMHWNERAQALVNAKTKGNTSCP